MQLDTWDLVELPADRNVIKCKWVYRRKTSPEGQLLKYKARLVAKGYSQEEGIDYQETFAPVLKFTSMKAMLAIACYEVDQIDFKTAF